MTIKEYFGDWSKVIDSKELVKILTYLKGSKNICPKKENIFRAFQLCPFNKCKVVILSQDPYPQPGIATGIAFGNNKEPLSPSLKILKEAVINYEIPHNFIKFDHTLESWCKQGILLLNSALTCEENNPASHVNLWRPFISKLIEKISLRDNGLVFVLLGKQAQSFKEYIKGNQCIIEDYHPSYYARIGSKMPYTTFIRINSFLKDQYNEQIKFFEEWL